MLRILRKEGSLIMDTLEPETASSLAVTVSCILVITILCTDKEVLGSKKYSFNKPAPLGTEHVHITGPYVRSVLKYIWHMPSS